MGEKSDKLKSTRSLAKRIITEDGIENPPPPPYGPYRPVIPFRFVEKDVYRTPQNNYEAMNWYANDSGEGQGVILNGTLIQSPLVHPRPPEYGGPPTAILNLEKVTNEKKVNDVLDLITSGGMTVKFATVTRPYKVLGRLRRPKPTYVEEQIRLRWPQAKIIVYQCVKNDNVELRNFRAPQ